MPTQETTTMQYSEPQFAAPTNAVRVEDIFGNLPMVTAVPTHTPKTFRSGFALDSTTGKFYYYDFTNSVWKTVGGASSYGGKVNADGTAGNLPAGWSSSVSAGNVYTITHNLNTAVYAVVAMTENANLPVTLLSPSTNSFTIEFDTGGGVATRTLFRFVLVLIV